MAFSGGKDSITIKALAEMAGVKYDAHYSVVGIDPPELVKFIKKYHSDVIFDRPKKTFWQGLVTNGYPTRQARWCCGLLKEKHGTGRRIITGVRWAESSNRKNRKLFETCYTDKTKRYVNVIIEWTNDDVWQFIKENNIEYCELYDKGFDRIGCLFCPNNEDRKRHVELYPNYIKTFIRFFEKRYKYCHERGLTSAKKFKSGEEMFNFWIYSNHNSKRDIEQQTIFE